MRCLLTDVLGMIVCSKRPLNWSLESSGFVESGPQHEVPPVLVLSVVVLSAAVVAESLGFSEPLVIVWRKNGHFNFNHTTETD